MSAAESSKVTRGEPLNLTVSQCKAVLDKARASGDYPERRPGQSTVDAILEKQGSTQPASAR